MSTCVVVVGGGWRKLAEVDLSIGTDRVEHHRVHARRQVDVSARDQIEIREVDRLNHIAAHAADAILRVRRDQLAVQDAGQGSRAVPTRDVTDNLGVGVGSVVDQIELAGAIHRCTGQVAEADHLDHGLPPDGVV